MCPHNVSHGHWLILASTSCFTPIYHNKIINSMRHIIPSVELVHLTA